MLVFFTDPNYDLEIIPIGLIKIECRRINNGFHFKTIRLGMTSSIQIPIENSWGEVKSDTKLYRWITRLCKQLKGWGEQQGMGGTDF